MQQALPAPPPSPRSLGLPPSRPRWAFPTNGDTGTRPFTGRCVLQARPPCVCPHFLFGTGRCAAAWTGHTGRAHSDAGGGRGGPACFLPWVVGSRAALTTCARASVRTPGSRSLGHKLPSGSAGPGGCTLVRSRQRRTRVPGPHVRANTLFLPFRAPPPRGCEAAPPWSWLAFR